MGKYRALCALALALAVGTVFAADPPANGKAEAENAVAKSEKASGGDWAMNATIIEACSCPMFCQCYFNDEPSAHPGCCPPDGDPKAPPRYCRFNNAFRVNHGSYGGVKLDRKSTRLNSSH